MVSRAILAAAVVVVMAGCEAANAGELGTAQTGLSGGGQGRGQQGPGRGPPQEALAACTGLSANASCTFTLNGQSLTGTCFAPPGAGALACRPDSMPPPPGGALQPGSGAPQGSGAPPGQPPHRGPPPEALAACASLTVDAACTFTLDGQTLTGTCAQGPRGGELACRPAGMPPRGPGRGEHRGPPQEALTACASLAVDAACTFTLGSQTLTGTCAQGPRGGELACRPAGMPPRGPGQDAHRGPPQEAVTACSGLSADAACAVTLGGESLAGTCTQPPHGGALACRPANLPPPPPGQGAHRGPPQEAVAACASLSANAACSFTLQGQALTGTCFSPAAGRPLACRPANMPPPPMMGPGGHRGPPQEAITACASLSADAACSFTMGSQDITGHCFQPPFLQSLVCHPDGMPMGPPPRQP